MTKKIISIFFVLSMLFTLGSFSFTADAATADGRAWRVTAQSGGYNLRAWKSDYATKIYCVPTGAEVNIISSSDNWAYVRYGSRYGYIPYTYLNYGQAYRVTTYSGLNLRSGSSTSSYILTTMPYGSKIVVSFIQNGWAYVKYGSRTGWCSARYISPYMVNYVS